jgi:hypothetical protein
MKTKDEPIQRGILFSKPMMESNIEGRKMETRRVIKNLPDGVDFIGVNEDGTFAVMGPCFEYACWGNIKSPYGQPGDILYARETIWTDQDTGIIAYEKDLCYEGGKWKCTPSIHMPKNHSRFWMEILDVKSEKLLDISEASAIAEGIELFQKGVWLDFVNKGQFLQCPRQSYFSLWDSINGKESHLLNPWVWAVKYKEIPNPNL